MYLVTEKKDYTLHQRMAFYRALSEHGFKPTEQDKVLELHTDVKHSFSKTRRLKSGLVVSEDVRYDECDKYEVDGIYGELIHPDKEAIFSNGIYIPNCPANNKRFNAHVDSDNPKESEYLRRVIINDEGLDIKLDSFAYLVSHGISEEDLETIPFLCMNAQKFVGVVDVRSDFDKKKKEERILKDLLTLLNSYADERYVLSKDVVSVRNTDFVVASVHQKERKRTK